MGGVGGGRFLYLSLGRAEPVSGITVVSEMGGVGGWRFSYLSLGRAKPVWDYCEILILLPVTRLWDYCERD